MRRTLSTSYGLNGLGFVPCHANAFSEDCGEVRRHVRNRRMRVGIEDLWGRCCWYTSGTYGDERTSSVTSMGPGMLRFEELHQLAIKGTI